MSRLRRIDPILIQAALAAALSFAHIQEIAGAAGQTGWKSWAYPVSVDLLMVMAWRRMRTGEGRAKRVAWFWFLLSLTASLGANVGTSGVLDLEALPTWLRVTVAGWPAVAFLGGSLLVHGTKAPDDKPQLTADDPPAEEVGPVPAEPATAPEKPILVSYAQVADALGISDVTVRGAANDGRLKKYAGPTANTVRVDMRECRNVLRSRKPVSP